MKSKLMGAALITSLSLGLTGCVINVGDKDSAPDRFYWEQKQEKNIDNLTKLSLGMAMDQVQLIMGTADFNEAFTTSENETKAKEEVQVLYYRTQWIKGDGKTTKDECTPVVFKNNTLVGWGDTALKNI
jgi:hypothetical protein